MTAVVARGGRRPFLSSGPTPEWLLRKDLACRDVPTEVFFPPVTQPVQVGVQRWQELLRRDPWVEPRAVCARCPVRVECAERELGFPIDTQYGFVGGMEPFERVQEIRRRRRAADADA